MARWYFPDATKYAVLGDYWHHHFNDMPVSTLENNVRQVIIDNHGRDHEDNPIDTTYSVEITDDKLRKKCRIFRPDDIPNLYYLNSILATLGAAQTPVNQQTLLGVYLIMKCR